jgi:hypothetical protein
MLNGDEFRLLSEQEYVDSRKAHNATNFDVLIELPYFRKVVVYLESCERAKTFCDAWRDLLNRAQIELIDSVEKATRKAGKA